MNTKPIFHDRPSLWSIDISLVLLTGFWALYTFTPALGDDLAFATKANATTDNFGSSFNVDFAVAWNHYIHLSDGRLANLICMFCLALPRWFVAIFSAFALIYIAFGSLRLVGIDGFKAPAALAFIALWLNFGIQWRDELLYMDFAINYLWSAALMLIFLKLFFDDKANWAISIIVALVLGIFQEGAAFPALCGCAAWGIFNLKRLSARRISMLVALIPGILYILFFSAMTERLENDAYSHAWRQPFGITQLFNSIISFTTVYLSVIVALLCLRTKRWKGFFQSSNIALICGGLAGLAIYVVFTYGGRMGLWATVLSAPCLYVGLRQLRHKSLSARAKTIFAALSFLLISVNLGYSSAKAVENSKVYREVIAEYVGSDGEKNIYHDLVDDNLLLSWEKVYSNLTNSSKQIERAYGNGKKFHLLPSSLQNFSAETLKPVGNDGFMSPDNHILLYKWPKEKGAVTNRIVAKITSCGITQTTRFYPISLTDGEGETWLYCPVGRLAVLIYLGGISDVELISEEPFK